MRYRHEKWMRGAVTAILLAAMAAGGPMARDIDDDADRLQDAEDLAEDRLDLMEDRAEDLADERADMDRAEARDAEDAADDAEDAAEDAADDAEDARDDAEDEADDARDEAEDDADDDADDAADDADDAGDDRAYGSSREMRDLASIEQPDYDERGFPVRRGELVVLDMDERAIAAAKAEGFGLIEQNRLAALDSSVSRLALPAGMSARDGMATLARIAPAAIVDRSHYYALQITPSGKTAPSRKSSGKSRSIMAASLPRAKGGLTIGMIDTGLSAHDSLKGTAITARDFSGGGAGKNAPSARDTSHGTAIASLLASQGGSTLYAANIFRHGHGGAPFTSADALIRALEWMAANKVKVVNISLAGPRNAILDRLVARTIAAGTTIVAAAGNGGPNAPPAYPAALPSVIAVTAVDERLRVYRYANQGRYIMVAANGVRQAAAQAGGGTALFTGTSFAAPRIAAWVARCRTAADSAACRAKLAQSARDLGAPGRDPVYGHGFIP